MVPLDGCRGESISGFTHDGQRTVHRGGADLAFVDDSRDDVEASDDARGSDDAYGQVERIVSGKTVVICSAAAMAMVRRPLLTE
jgi:hypothetical protein